MLSNESMDYVIKFHCLKYCTSVTLFITFNMLPFLKFYIGGTLDGDIVFLSI